MDNSFEEEQNDDDFLEDLGLGASPRCVHYTFAHQALRQVAFEHPLHIMNLLASEERHLFLEQLWTQVEDFCDESDEELSFKDIRLHLLQADGFPCAIIQMPLPKCITEAHYIGLILNFSLESEKPNIKPEDTELLYFTLEKGFQMDGKTRTVLCQWTKEGFHLNQGDGPKANLDDFFAEITQRANKNFKPKE